MKEFKRSLEGSGRIFGGNPNSFFSQSAQQKKLPEGRVFFAPHSCAGCGQKQFCCLIDLVHVQSMSRFFDRDNNLCDMFFFVADIDRGDQILF